MIKIIKNDHVSRLRKIYDHDSPSRAILDYLAKYVRGVSISTVDRIALKSGASYAETFKVFKLLESIGLGTCKIGRRGGITRIEWDYHLGSVGRAARGEAEEISLRDDSNSDDVVDGNLPPAKDEPVPYSGSLNQHSFKLRPDLTILFQLPSDLTEREAQRLATFVTSLPYE